jgi:CTP:molybdopterin cytidylyltransferase MocA
MQAAAVILAAGTSTRFGSPKQLAPIGGGTMLDAVIEVARASGLRPILAVVPRGIGVAGDVVPVPNDAPHQGLSHSLRLGLAALHADVDAAVILLGDQPTLDPETVGALLAEARRTDRPVVAAHADRHIGPPIVLARTAFTLADEATGDEGLRGVLERHPELVSIIEVGRHAPDVDTPADLEALRRR